MWIHLSTLCLVIFLMTDFVAAEQVSEYSEWTSWTVCSMTCNRGIQMRTRDCKKEKYKCATEKEVKVCQQHECQGKIVDPRDHQCRQFNKQVISGRQYYWSGYINEKDPCQLHCKASHYGFYKQFDDKVEDGASCRDSSGDHICLDGHCKRIGCDGIVGSDASFDQCGVCNGDSSSCQLISGIFTRRYLSYGYNLISRIPAGACNINITEMGRSRNYLALKLTDGNYIFNGNYRLSRESVFTEAGTDFKYQRNKRSEGCPGECIYAKGPTTKSVDLELLFYQSNPGITYQFTVPKNLTEYFMRNMVPNLRPNPREQEITSQNALSNKQKDVYMITNPNELNRYRNSVNTGSSSRTNVNAQSALQPKPGYDLQYHTSSSDTNKHDQINRQNVYTYPDGYDVNKQAAAGDYGQQASSSNNIPPDDIKFTYRNGYPAYSNGIPVDSSVQNPSYNNDNSNGYPVYSNGIPLGGSVQNPSYSNGNGNGYPVYNNGIPLGETVDSHGVPLGGFVNSNGIPISSNGIPLAGTLDRPPLVIANNIPDSKNYFWRISGFTECSRTCGGGLQETQIICLKKDTNVMVTNENCEPRLRPQTQVLKCNSNICPPNWESGNWSECTASCGQGMQTRPVLCKQLIDTELHLEVSVTRCDTRTRPESSRSCKTRACAEWTTGEWGKCSVNCGRGQKKRDVYCKHIDARNTTETDCEGRKPDSQQTCDMGACAVGWLYSKWSRRCSASCGSGYVTRKVFCSAADGTPLSETKCDGPKPKDKRQCRSRIPCGGIWFEGPWSKCSATCGEGIKKRDVICMKKLGENLIIVVEEENCVLKEKPTTTKPCKDLPTCQSEWFMTSWSECSKTCDTGTKSRIIKCLDQDLQPSSSCPADIRPDTRIVCNTESCDVPQLDEDPGCTDKLQNCKRAMKAGLCEYPFYQSTCCRSCKKHEHRTHQNKRRL